MKILIRDENLTGKVAREFQLQLETSTITIRELIRSRIYEEVKVFNSNRNMPYMGGTVVKPGPLKRIKGERCCRTGGNCVESIC